MTRLKRQWEEIKEMGFNLVSVGVMAANLYTFYVILTQGVYQIWEPWKWLLIIEFSLDFLFICWGAERIYMDGKRIKLRRSKGEI